MGVTSCKYAGSTQILSAKAKLDPILPPPTNGAPNKLSRGRGEGDATIVNMSHTYNMSRVSAPTRPFLNRRRSIDEKYFGANSKDSMEDFLDQMNEEMRL